MTPRAFACDLFLALVMVGSVVLILREALG